jgi:hypothetical protein
MRPGPRSHPAIARSLAPRVLVAALAAIGSVLTIAAASGQQAARRIELAGLTIAPAAQPRERRAYQHLAGARAPEAGLAEYAWDFTRSDRMSGFGPRSPAKARLLLKHHTAGP